MYKCTYILIEQRKYGELYRECDLKWDKPKYYIHLVVHRSVDASFSHYVRWFSQLQTYSWQSCFHSLCPRIQISCWLADGASNYPLFSRAVPNTNLRPHLDPFTILPLALGLNAVGVHLKTSDLAERNLTSDSETRGWLLESGVSWRISEF